MTTDTRAEIREDPNVRRLEASLHDAQARGLFVDREAVRQLLAGIVSAVASSVEGNARNPATAAVLQSDTYWNHFEMDLKETLLGAFAWVEPDLHDAVRRVLDATFSELKRIYRYS